MCCEIIESQCTPVFKEGGIRSLLLKQTKLIKISCLIVVSTI
jgi:hypothetical protein